MRPGPRVRIGRRMLAVCATLVVSASVSAQHSPQKLASPQHTPQRHATGTRAARPARSQALRLVDAARKQIGVTVVYDPAYVVLKYPGGDVAKDRGVCTDVVIRAFRAQDTDLQRLLHEDMRGNFARYPKNWGLRTPDRNIDHRRVPNLQTWFARQGWVVSSRGERAGDARASDFLPGDLVTWMLPGNLPHIGIVSDRKSLFGTPLIIHNIGRGTREEDVLFEYRITGHYRPKMP
jgi:uncharacterized protein